MVYFELFLFTSVHNCYKIFPDATVELLVGMVQIWICFSDWKDWFLLRIQRLRHRSISILRTIWSFPPKKNMYRSAEIVSAEIFVYERNSIKNKIQYFKRFYCLKEIKIINCSSLREPKSRSSTVTSEISWFI